MKNHYITDTDRNMTIEDLIQWYNLPLDKFMSLRFSERQKRTDEFWYEIRNYRSKLTTKQLLIKHIFKNLYCN